MTMLDPRDDYGGKEGAACGQGDPIAPANGFFAHAGAPGTDAVTARFHGYGQFVGTAESAHKKRHD